MTTSEAARLLEVAENASPEELEQRFQELRAKLEERIGKAPTPGLKEKYRVSLAEITTAFETLTLAADGSELPVLQRAAAKPGAPAADKPAAAPEPVARPHPARAAAEKPGISREFVLVAVIAVAVLGGGGWWVMKTRSEAAEKARLEAEAKLAAERQAVAAKAEAERIAAEAKAAAEKEKARQDSEMARLRAAQAEAKIRWETFEREAGAAERRLSEFKSEVREAEKADKPPEDQAELKARLSAQTDYVEWLQPVLSRHPARTQLARLDALLSARALADAVPAERELVTSLAALDKETAAQKANLLALGKVITLDSEPPGLVVSVTNSHGRGFKGVTPLALNLPWGSAWVSVASPGPGWPATEATLVVDRAAEPRWVARYGKTSAAISSSPSGLAYELSNAAGLRRSGTTPADLSDLPSGPARLVVKRPGWPDVVRETVLAADQPAALAAEFVGGRVSVESEPPGATVLREGKALGVTPLTIPDLVPGEAAFELRLSGFRTTPVRTPVTGGQTASVSVKLASVPRGLIRPDFERGPLRFSVSSNSERRDSQGYSSTFVQEYSIAFTSATGISADATKITTTISRQFDRSNNPILAEYQGKGDFYPNSVIEYIKQDNGWAGVLKSGGSKWEEVNKIIRSQILKPEIGSGMKRFTGLELAEFWPETTAQEGEVWSVPARALKELFALRGDDPKGSVTGKVRSYRVEGDERVAEVEFEFDLSAPWSSDTVSGLQKVSGRINCTIDLAKGYVTERTYIAEMTESTEVRSSGYKIGPEVTKMTSKVTVRAI